jgi:hypothetical protein
MMFIQGFLFCTGAAGLFAAFVYVVRRMDREDELDFDAAAPDGFVTEEDKL